MNNMNMEVVEKCFDCIIVGGGIAGLTCAEQLYALDDEISLLLITGGEYVKTVSNVHPVSKTLDMFDVEDTSSELWKSRFPSVVVSKCVVTGLDSSKKVVYSHENAYKYKKLCICSGALPKTLKEDPHVLTIRDTESVKKFQERVSSSRRIVVVGNGGIASEIVYEMCGMEVIWVVRDRSFNSVFIDPGAAEFLKPNLHSDSSASDSVATRRKYVVNSSDTDCEVTGVALGPDWLSSVNIERGKNRKIHIETEVEVDRILKPSEVLNVKEDVLKPFENSQFDVASTNSWPVYVQLTNNKIYGCDLIVSAIGVDPNTRIFTGDNKFTLGQDRGLLVNEKMETSIKDVFAAGDVCSVGWEPAAHWFQMRLWTQARQMGAYAAKCIWASLHNEEIYMDFCFEMFAHATKFFGQKVILLGLYNGQTIKGKYEILLRVTKGKEYVKCVMVDGQMQGAILIGETDLEETFENLILNQMDLTSYGEDLLNPDIDIEDYFD